MADRQDAFAGDAMRGQGHGPVDVHWCPGTAGPRRMEGRDLAARLAALGLAVREVAGDLRSLRGHVAVGGRTPGLGAAGAGHLHRALDRVESATGRAVALWQRLRGSAASHSARRPALSLNEAVRQALRHFAGLAAAGIAVRTQLDRALWLVRADPRLLERMLSTLLSRSVAALPEGGTLTLRTENVTRDEKVYGCRPRPMAGGWVCLTAAERARASEGGPLHRIFSPFAAAAGEPTHDLAALLAVVRQLGGRLSADPLPAGGAALRIYLPAASGVEWGAVEGSSAEPSLEGRRPEPAALA